MKVWCALLSVQQVVVAGVMKSVIGPSPRSLPPKLPAGLPPTPQGQHAVTPAVDYTELNRLDLDPKQRKRMEKKHKKEAKKVERERKKANKKGGRDQKEEEVEVDPVLEDRRVLRGSM